MNNFSLTFFPACFPHHQQLDLHLFAINADCQNNLARACANACLHLLVVATALPLTFVFIDAYCSPLTQMRLWAPGAWAWKAHSHALRTPLQVCVCLAIALGLICGFS